MGEFINRIAIYYPGLTAINAANSIKGRALAPGSIVTAQRQGSLFTDSTVTADQATWPAELADTQVLVNDSPAPIRDVKPDELNFLMPMSAPPGGSVEVQVVRKSTGQILGAGQVDMAPASPALFTRNGFGTGQLVANNDDGSANEPSHPISRGKVISIFGTGLGFVSTLLPTVRRLRSRFRRRNRECSWDRDSSKTPTASRMAASCFQVLAPGQIGIWQIDVKVPDFVGPFQPGAGGRATAQHQQFAAAAGDDDRRKPVNPPPSKIRDRCKARQAETPAPPVSDHKNQLTLPGGAGVSACRAAPGIDP